MKLVGKRLMGRISDTKIVGRGACRLPGLRPAPSALLLAATALLMTAATAGAADYYVGTVADLAYRIENAAAGDTIHLTGTITLDRELPPITTAVTIDGGGHKLQGDDTYRGIFVDVPNDPPTTVTVTELTFEGCKAEGGAGGDGLAGGGGGGGLGGAVFVRSGSVDMTDCYFKENQATGGDGGLNTGAEVVDGTEFNYNNTAGGGGGLGGDGGTYHAGTDAIGGGGDGGFGGGGGGAMEENTVGVGGFGAGTGGVDDPLVRDGDELVHYGAIGGTGGGGLGAGGAVFVSKDGSVSIRYTQTTTEDKSFVDNDTTGGAGGGGTATDGQAIGDALFLGGNVTLNVDPSRTVTIDQDFGGAADEDNFDPTNVFATDYADAGGGINKTGTGTLILKGNNTYIGDTTITEGTLVAKENNAIGDYSNVALNGGTLQLDQDETIGYLTGTSGTVKLNGKTLTLIGTKENNPNVAFAGTFDVDSVSSPGTALTSSKVIKDGDGKLILSGDNSGADFQLEIRDGTIAIGHQNALGDPSGTAVRVYTSPYQQSTDLSTLEATTDLTTGTGGAVAKNFQIESDSELRVGGAHDIELRGRIRGTALAMRMDTPSDRLILSNDSTVAADMNQFATMRILRGTLEVNSEAALGGSRILVDGSGTLQSSAADLTLSNRIELNNASILTVGGTNNMAFSGSISGTGGIAKAGSTTLTLSGVNSYTGQTTIGGDGVLALSGGSAIWNGGLVNIGAAATLQVDAAETIGALSGSGFVTLNANLTLNGRAGSLTETYGGVISGGGKLIKQGSHTLLLTGINTYSGGTDLVGGSLAINQSGVCTSLGSGAIAFSNNATLLLQADGAILNNGVTVNATGGRVLYDEAVASGSHSFTLTPQGAAQIAGPGVLYIDLKGTSGAASVLTVDQSKIATGFGGFSLAEFTTLQFSAGAGAIDFGLLQGGGVYDANNNPVNFTSASDTTFSATLENVATLTKNGAGRLTLDGANLSANGLDIQTGTLASNGSTLDIGAGGVTYGPSGGILSVTGGSFTSTGAITVSDGGVLRVNPGTGSFTANGGITVNAGGLFTVEGAVTGNVVNNGGTVHAGNSPGTRTITGDFENNGGTINVDIEGGQNSLLKVSGTATMNGGTVAVAAAPGESLYAGQKFTFLTAGSIVNGAALSATFNNARYQLQLGNDATNYWFTLAPTTFFNGINSFSANQLAMGDYLTAVDPLVTAGSDMETVIDALRVLPAGTQGPTYDCLTGEIYGSTSAIGIEGTSAALRVLTTELRPGAIAWETDPQTAGGYPYAAVDPEAALVRGQSPLDSMWTVWGSAYGLRGNAYSDGNAHGFNYSLQGAVTGVQRDYALGSNLGAYYSYSQSYLEGNVLSDTVDTKNHFWGAYLTRDAAIGYTIVIGGFGYDEYDATRAIHIDGSPAIDRTAANKHSGWQSAVYAEHGLTYGSSDLFLQPYGALQYVYLSQEGFTESGADSVNLVVDQIGMNSFRTVLGGRLAAKVFGPTVEFRGQWIHELLDEKTPMVNAQFSGGGAVSAFGIRGVSLGRDWGLVGGGLDWQVGPRFRVFAGYDWQVNAQQSLHVGSGGMEYAW